MATSSSIERATLSLEVTGLLPIFEGRIFCASMVARGKPAPDLFLHAASAFGADPAKCLVIEDSEVGLLAGQERRDDGLALCRRQPFQGRAALGRQLNPPFRCFDSMDAMAATLRSD